MQRWNDGTDTDQVVVTGQVQCVVRGNRDGSGVEQGRRWRRQLKRSGSNGSFGGGCDGGDGDGGGNGFGGG